MAGRFGPRFGIEAAFLIAVAVVLGLLEVTWPAIVAAMAIAWLLVAAVEVALSRERARPEPVAAPVPEGEPSEGFQIVAKGEEEELFVAPAAEAPAPAEEAELPRVAEPAEPEPMVTPAAEVPPEEAELPPAAAAAEERLAEREPEPELVPAAAAEELPPPPPPPVLEPVPSVPAPVAAVPEPEPAPEPEREPEPEPEPQVVELYPGAPREWNLWELERLARDHAGDDPIRDEEWSFLLIYLREFASPDGHLPRDFDGLVRESFGDILRAPR